MALALTGFANAAESTNPTAVFFMAGDDPDDPWAINLRSFANAAAKDLAIDLEILFSGTGRKELRDSVQHRIETGDKPDFALIINYRGSAEDILQYLDDQRVNTFLFNAGLTADAYERVGQPREKIKHWLGELIPDDERAGYDLAKFLIREARRRNGKKTIRIIGITGSYANPVAQARVEGLKSAIAEEEDVELLQIVSARWSSAVAKEKYEHLHNRYGDINVVWSANDEMAMGVIHAGGNGNAGLIVGGMDWTAAARDAIKNGELAASMGGHFIDVAYILAFAKLYAEGVDFARATGNVSPRSVLSILTRVGIDERSALFNAAAINKFDFTTILNDPSDAAGHGEISINRFLHEQECNGRETHVCSDQK